MRSDAPTPDGLDPDSPHLVAKRNFVLQQGFEAPSRESCALRYSALTFQPKIVAGLLLVGILFQSPVLFGILAALLWWSAALPNLNPFDAIHNLRSARSSEAIQLPAAPPPRRFAQALAGLFSAAISVALAFGVTTVAYALEFFFAAAVVALAFGRFCLGSFLFHLLIGRSEFARRTLPWAQ